MNGTLDLTPTSSAVQRRPVQQGRLGAGAGQSGDRRRRAARGVTTSILARHPPSIAPQ